MRGADLGLLLFLPLDVLTVVWLVPPGWKLPAAVALVALTGAAAIGVAHGRARR